jgi:hypothetical protein
VSPAPVGLFGREAELMSDSPPGGERRGVARAGGEAGTPLLPH